jgi:hypothetical protein
VERSQLSPSAASPSKRMVNNNHLANPAPGAVNDEFDSGSISESFKIFLCQAQFLLACAYLECFLMKVSKFFPFGYLQSAENCLSIFLSKLLNC